MAEKKTNPEQTVTQNCLPCLPVELYILLFLVEHVHVLGTQFIIFSFEKLFPRDLLCLLYFTLLVGLMDIFSFLVQRL